MRYPPLITRLESGIVFPANPEGCWVWSGGQTANGYGRFSRDGRTTNVHRVMFELVFGPVGDLYVLHHCDNKTCCNPRHLYAGTQSDNLLDDLRRNPSRSRSERDRSGHCVKGHPVSVGLVLRRRRGYVWFVCRECVRGWRLAGLERRKQQRLARRTNAS